MAIEAIKKILRGDTQIPTAGIEDSAITAAKVGTAAVTNAKLYASAVGASKFGYKHNKFSLTLAAIGILSAASATYSITITSGAKVIGMFITALTSHANIPLVSTPGATSVTVSVAQPLIGSDICEGVVITLEP